MNMNLPEAGVTPVSEKEAMPGSADTGDDGLFSTKLARFKIWRDNFITSLEAYQSWAEQHESSDEDEKVRIDQLIDELKADKVKVAFVGEFSRGKTELLNALFFSGNKGRLLPSSAGRTTMCPTELRYDKSDDPCLRLLPIETRKTDSTIAELRKSPAQWTTIHLLKRDSEDELQEAFSEVTKIKRVHIREAEALGLYDPENEEANVGIDITDNMLSVPVWRHAIINLPHPLLEHGLVILDTPGLNALGAEPELTVSMLPESHAIVFLLAADTGVTASDKEVWSSHVVSAKQDKMLERMVVLNKIDAMWDPLRTDNEIQESINKQIGTTAQILDEDRKNVFPVSAKEALSGLISGDSMKVEKSGIAALEKRLADEILPAKYEIIRRKVVYEVSGRIERSQSLLRTRKNELLNNLKQLREVSGKNTGEVQKLISNMREEKKKYDIEIRGFELTKKVLTEQATLLFKELSLDTIDKMIVETRRNMSQSWTTYGLQSSIKLFFDSAMIPMENVRGQAIIIKKALDEIFIKLNKDYGLQKIEVPALSLISSIMELKKLEGKSEVFRKSTSLIITEQSNVINKFFITLVAEARKIYSECNQQAQAWFKGLAKQVKHQISTHKEMIDRGIETIRIIHGDMNSVSQHVSKLEEEISNVNNQLNAINSLLEKIQKPIE